MGTSLNGCDEPCGKVIDGAGILVSGGDGEVWTGAVSAGTTALVIGWYRSAAHVGQDMTFDGSVTGEVRHVTLDDFDICVKGWTDNGIYVANKKKCHLSRASKIDVQVMTYGDSGGPTYQYTNAGTVGALGTAVGWCGDCSSYYTDIWYELDGFNLSILHY